MLRLKLVDFSAVSVALPYWAGVALVLGHLPVPIAVAVCLCTKSKRRQEAALAILRILRPGLPWTRRGDAS